MLVSWRGSIVFEFGGIWLPGSDGEKIESFWIVWVAPGFGFCLNDT